MYLTKCFDHNSNSAVQNCPWNVTENNKSIEQQLHQLISRQPPLWINTHWIVVLQQMELCNLPLQFNTTSSCFFVVALLEYAGFQFVTSRHHDFNSTLLPSIVLIKPHGHAALGKCSLPLQSRFSLQIQLHRFMLEASHTLHSTTSFNWQVQDWPSTGSILAFEINNGILDF